MKHILITISLLTLMLLGACGSTLDPIRTGQDESKGTTIYLPAGLPGLNDFVWGYAANPYLADQYEFRFRIEAVGEVDTFSIWSRKPGSPSMVDRLWKRDGTMPMLATGFVNPVKYGKVYFHFENLTGHSLGDAWIYIP